jgi:hypothetical protein
VRRNKQGSSEEFIGTGQVYFGQVYELYIPIPAHLEHTCSLRIPGDFFWGAKIKIHLKTELKFPRYCSVGSSIRPLDVHSFVRRSPRTVSSLGRAVSCPSVAQNCLHPYSDSLEAWECSLLSIGRPELSRKISCIISSSTVGRGKWPRKFRVAVSNTPWFLRRFVQQSPESPSVSRRSEPLISLVLSNSKKDLLPTRDEFG